MKLLASTVATVMLGATAVLPTLAMEVSGSTSLFAQAGTSSSSVSSSSLSSSSSVSSASSANSSSSSSSSSISSSSSSKSSSSSSSKKGGKQVDYLCVQGHVATREGALGTALASFNTKMVDAYGKRKTDLNTAWGTSDAKQRREKVKAAWNTFKDSKKAAAKQWKADHKTAWKTFKQNVKNCGKADVSLEIMGEFSED